MDARQQRGLVIAATCKIEKKARNIFLVPSQSKPGARYYVEPTSPRCDCPDFEDRGEPCKHIFAVQYVIEREKNPDGSATVTETLTVTKKKTYSQDWPAYNAAQQTEKRWFLSLLADLCKSIPEPERKPSRGRPPIALADSIFAACFKVYSGFSARRFTCDLESAVEDGHISRAIHFNSVLNVLVIGGSYLSPSCCLNEECYRDGDAFSPGIRANTLGEVAVKRIGAKTTLP